MDFELSDGHPNEKIRMIIAKKGFYYLSFIKEIAEKPIEQFSS